MIMLMNGTEIIENASLIINVIVFWILGAIFGYHLRGYFYAKNLKESVK